RHQHPAAVPRRTADGNGVSLRGIARRSMAIPAHQVEEIWASSPFGAFAPERRQRSRRWLVSLLVASALYASAIAGIVLLGGAPMVRVAQKMVDVTFVEKIVKPE